MGDQPAARRRAKAAFIVLTLLFSGILFRLYDLQIAGHESYRRIRDDQATGRVDQRQPRGTIFDARGDALAISVPAWSVAASPACVKNAEQTAASLAPVMGAVAPDLRQQLTKTRKGPDGVERPADFVWIRRQVPADVAQAIRKLNLPGIFLKPEYDRVYPQGRLLAHVIGIADIDDQGDAGLEGLLNEVLAGDQRQMVVDVDGRRRSLSSPDLGSSGADIHLTIDARFQKVVEDALDAACERHTPTWACAVAIDPRTGAILALANRPAYDPNRPTRDAGYRNLAVHPRTGAMLLTRLAQYPPALARGVAEHHERLDGSGYPGRLLGNAISPLGRQLAVVEVVLGVMAQGDAPWARASFALRMVPGEFDAQVA